MCVSGYTGTGRGLSGNYQYAPGYTADASYTGGLTEEEQLEEAIRNSLNDRGKAGGDSFDKWKRVRVIYFLYLSDVTGLSFFSFLFLGQTRQRGAPPPYGFHLSEDARAEQIRQMRLRRFDRWMKQRQGRRIFYWKVPNIATTSWGWVSWIRRSKITGWHI